MRRTAHAIAAVAFVLAAALPAQGAPSFAAGPTLAQMASQVPPVSPNLARVWFLRQYEPGESLYTPQIYVNGQPFAASVPGTAFYRDFAPGQYTFSVETCTHDANQKAQLSLAAGSVTDLEVQSLSSMQSWDCMPPINFYARVIPPRWVELYSTQLTYLGAR